MFVYEKKLQYPVRIKNPNPALAKFIISQYGGPDGELGASMRYLSQRFSMPYPELAGILQWLRNTGTMLKPDEKFKYKLVPWVGNEGWSSEAEYRKESAALKPYRTQLVMILKKLGGK